MYQFLSSILGMIFSIVIALVAVAGTVAFMLRKKRERREAQNIRAENDMFWQLVLGSDGSAMRPVGKLDWKTIIVLQPYVDRILSNAAVELNVTLHRENSLLADSKREQAVEILPSAALRNIEGAKNNVRSSKEYFWKIAGIAQRLGFTLRKESEDGNVSFKLYLPKNSNIVAAVETA